MPDRAGFGRATAPIRSASAAWRPSAIAPVPIAADSRNFLRETPRRPAMCVYLGAEPYKRDTRSTRRSQQVSFTCDLFTGGQPSAQWRSTAVSGGAVCAKAIGDCRLTAVYGPAERRALIDRVLHVQSRAALDQQPDDGLMTGRNSLMQRRRVRVVALRVVPVGILSGVEQHAGDGHGIGRRFLTVAFDAVRRDVVQQGRPVARRIEFRDARRTGPNELWMRAEQRRQQRLVSIDHRFDG